MDCGGCGVDLCPPRHCHHLQALLGGPSCTWCTYRGESLTCLSPAQSLSPGMSCGSGMWGVCQHCRYSSKEVWPACHVLVAGPWRGAREGGAARLLAGTRPGASAGRCWAALSQGGSTTIMRLDRVR